MQYIELVLFPIIYVMRVLLELFHSVSSSYGIAIVLLSVVMSFAILPTARYGKRIQDEEEALQERMRPEIEAAKKELKGEEQFLRIEAIYKRHNYHPIHSLKSMAGLLPQIPFLLAALFLLWDHPPLSGQSFLFVRDLGLPDALIAFGSGNDAFRINLLPFLMSGISLIEVFMAKGSGAGTKVRLSIVSLVLLLLVYQLPAAVLVYWTSNNIISLLRAVIGGRAGNTQAE
jgi:YidC/Oxa1 family membrane protein insertase